MFWRLALPLSSIMVAVYLVSDQKKDTRQCSLTSFPSSVEYTNQQAVATGSIDQEMWNELSEKKNSIREIELRNSPGGIVSFAKKIADLNITVRVTGTHCTSACVMMLLTHKNVCLASEVEEVRFHSVSNVSCRSGALKRVLNRERTIDFLKSLPAGLRTRVAAIADKDMIVAVPAKELLTYYPNLMCTETTMASREK